jgi:hypothetical protein
LQDVVWAKRDLANRAQLHDRARQPEINDGELPEWVANWSTDDSVASKAGALIVMALKDFTIRTTTNGVKNTVNVEETRYGILFVFQSR